MLDERDLQAIAALIDAKFDEQNKRIDAKFAEQDKRIDAKFAEQDKRIDAMFAEQKREIMADVRTLMDEVYTPQFKLLAENQQMILEKMVPVERIEDIELDVRFLKSMYKELARDLAEVKRKVG